MPRRIAIVIGVRRAEGFAELPGAAAGADAFARWAASDGFEVSRYVDDAGPVTVGPIVDEIDALVNALDVEQLFIYFAGHGDAGRIDEDYWVLSPGTARPREVVDVGESVRLARHARIPHVAIFADACRTLTTERTLGVLHGASPLFPYLGVAAQKADLDVFYAARTANPAYEVTAGGASAQPQLTDDGIIAAHGVFTRLLMAALEGRDDRAARRDPLTGEKVIHAQSLAQFLRDQVEYESSMLPVPAPQIADCRPSSTLPRRIATLGMPSLAELTVEAQLEGGAPATNAALAILRFDQGAVDPWTEVRAGRGPRLSATLPVMQPYGLSASLPMYERSPAAPQPVQFLQSASTCTVKLMPVPAGTPIPPPTRVPSEELPAPGPTLTRTFLVDEAGQPAAVAPHHGVFFVSTEDVLTGRTSARPCTTSSRRPSRKVRAWSSRTRWAPSSPIASWSNCPIRPASNCLSPLVHRWVSPPSRRRCPRRCASRQASTTGSTSLTSATSSP
jgi:hypothetical protein